MDWELFTLFLHFDDIEKESSQFEQFIQGTNNNNQHHNRYNPIAAFVQFTFHKYQLDKQIKCQKLFLVDNNIPLDMLNMQLYQYHHNNILHHIIYKMLDQKEVNIIPVDTAIEFQFLQDNKSLLNMLLQLRQLIQQDNRSLQHSHLYQYLKVEQQDSNLGTTNLMDICHNLIRLWHPVIVNSIQPHKEFWRNYRLDNSILDHKF